jgi:hypothetical protein
MTVRNLAARLAGCAAFAFLIAPSFAHAANTSTNTSNNTSTNTSSDPGSSNFSSNSSGNSSSRRGRIDDYRRDERVDERGDGRFVGYQYDLYESHRDDRGVWRRRYSEGGYAERDDRGDDD